MIVELRVEGPVHEINTDQIFLRFDLIVFKFIHWGGERAL